MTVLRSVSWDDEKKKRRRAALALTTVFLVLPVAPEFVFPVGDVESLAKKLSAVATNRERLQQVRQSALELIRQWSPEKTTEGLIRSAVSTTARE